MFVYIIHSIKGQNSQQTKDSLVFNKLSQLEMTYVFKCTIIASLVKHDFRDGPCNVVYQILTP